MNESALGEKKCRLGQIVGQAMEKKGLSIRQLSYVSKVPKNYLTKVVRGTAHPHKGALLRISREFILTKTEACELMSMISDLCSFLVETSCNRNYSKKVSKMKIFPRKRPSIPISVRISFQLKQKASSRFR